MNRPELHNAFDEAVDRRADRRVLRALDDDRTCASWCWPAGAGASRAGADLNWMKRAAGYALEENLRDARALAEMLRTLASPVEADVARVHGRGDRRRHGPGRGLRHRRRRRTGRVFALSEVRLGLIPAAIAPTSSRRSASAQARRYFLTAERIEAARARELGSRPRGRDPAGCARRPGRRDPRGAARRTAPKAQTAAKELIRAVAQRPVTDALVEDTAQRIARIRATPEAARHRRIPREARGGLGGRSRPD